MKLFKAVLILTSTCMTGLSAHAVEQQPPAAADAPTTSLTNQNPPAEAPPNTAETNPKEAAPVAKPEPTLADPDKRDSLLEARMIRLDLKYLMEHACSAQALRLGPATERIGATVLDERKKNPDKSLIQLSLARPDLEADTYALFYHKSKCLSDFIAKRLGEDFKLNRLKDKTDMKAQVVKKALTDLRDELEIRSLNRGDGRCESNALSDEMNCVTKMIVPAMEGSLVQSAINTLLNQADTDQTLEMAKDEQLQRLRNMIALARMKDAQTVRGAAPADSAPMGTKAVN